jgi:RecJ-like exonuclease
MNATQQLARLHADLNIEKLVKANFGSKKSKANVHIIANLKQFSTTVVIKIFENNIIVSKQYDTFKVIVTFDRSCNVKEIEISTAYMSNCIVPKSEYFVDFELLEKMLDSIHHTTSAKLLPLMNLDADKFVEQITYN